MAKQTRSPNYPSIGLPTAIDFIQKIWASDKRTPLSPEAVGRACGYSSYSGPARSAFAALRKYGLLEASGDGYRLSDLAMEILHGDPVQKSEAISTAALKVPIFRELAASHLDASEATLRSHLLTKLKFTEDGASRLIKAFFATKGFANLGEPSTIDEQEPLLPAPSTERVRVGSFVRWLSGGKDHFKEPKQVFGISEDGKWVFVEGHPTGIPMDDTFVDSGMSGVIAPPPNPHLDRVGASQGPRIEFPLPDDNSIEIRLRKPVSKKTFERIKQLVNLSEESLVAQSGDKG
jgi:hypothetical protein